MRKEVTRTLACKLTEEEITAKGRALASAVEERESHAQELKNFTELKKMEIKALDAEIKTMAKQIETEEEDREVKCVWNYNQPRRGMKQLIRLDSHEIVDELDMTDYDKAQVADELQLRIV